MEIFDNLLFGLSVALSFENLLYCAIGALLGTLIGVLPGLGPSTTIALLLPITFGLSPVSAMIMLAGIFYGAQYGGSTTSILVNLPGEPSSVVTCIDGYQMAKKGRAGQALAVAAIGSLFAGFVGTVFVAVLSPPLAKMALSFGPHEYFGLMVLGLMLALTLSSGSIVKSVGMVVMGLLFGCIGTDVSTGIQRFTFGFFQLGDGLDFVVIAMGIFGVAEIMRNLETSQNRTILYEKIPSFWPTKTEIWASGKAVVRGTALGTIFGPLPGAGVTIASFSAYALERKLSRHPEKFGMGVIEGVAAPEAANNASAQTSFIPLLTLGIPGGSVTALMLGALMLHGITPGPQIMTRNPDLFWGLIASMFIGNIILVILNLPLIGLWVRLLRVPYEVLFPVILSLCAIGAFGLNNSVFDVQVLTVFAVFGYILLKLGCEPAPLLLGFILGPMMEETLTRALIISRGDATTFLTRPLSATLLLGGLALVIMAMLPAMRRRRNLLKEDD